ncbi:hypothetical protein LSAT2_031033 [Lamellibrachia satsuma]|nr:hypothetical protein LSAT2_031033 [Lamellibrachia satsuma]
MINPSHFRNMSHLETLNLFHNRRLKISGNAFHALKSLKYLFLSQTSVTTLSAHMFSNMTRLVRLDLRESGLTTMNRDSFGNLSNLEELNLAHNKLETIQDDIFNGLVQLRNLYMNHNYLKTISPTAFNHLSNLEYLRLEHNQLRTISDDAFGGHCRSLKNLILFKNELTTLSEALFRNMSNLTNLVLSNNLFETISDDVFNGPRHSLTNLDLSTNELTTISQATFRNMSNLQTLDLSNNLLETIADAAFSGTSQSLRALNLDTNKLTTLGPALFHNMPHLYILSLSNNLFETIQENPFDGLKYMMSLDLYGNPFTCDCRLAWIRTIPDIGGSCVNPPILNGTSILSYDISLCMGTTNDTGPPMTHTSETRSPTNSDPVTTAEQAEEVTYVPTAVKADGGCSSPGRRGLSCHRGTDVFLSNLCRRRGRPYFVTLNDTTRRLLPRAHHQRPTPMDEWQRGQDREIWKSLVTDLHVGGGLSLDTCVAVSTTTGSPAVVDTTVSRPTYVTTVTKVSTTSSDVVATSTVDNVAHATTHGPTRESSSIGHSTHFTTEDEAITRSAYITTETSRTDTTKDNVEQILIIVFATLGAVVVVLVLGILVHTKRIQCAKCRHGVTYTTNVPAETTTPSVYDTIADPVNFYENTIELQSPDSGD